MKLLVSDYDGTFATSDEDIKINCKLLKKFIKNGNHFLLSSGRPLNSLKRQVEMYEIPYTYLGVSDGNFLYNKEDKLIMENHMSSDILEKISDIKRLDIYEQIQYTYSKENSLEVKDDEKLGSIAFVIKKENITDDFLNQYKKLEEENKEYQFDVYGFKSMFYYMIRPKGINKSSPIIHLEHELNIPKSKIFTIGDNINDIEMIRDYNGFMTGDNKQVEEYALKKYNAVHELIKDINKKKVLKRW